MKSKGSFSYAVREIWFLLISEIVHPPEFSSKSIVARDSLTGRKSKNSEIKIKETLYKFAKLHFHFLLLCNNNFS